MRAGGEGRDGFVGMYVECTHGPGFESWLLLHGSMSVDGVGLVPSRATCVAQQSISQ
jgi:hypothetical protein